MLKPLICLIATLSSIVCAGAQDQLIKADAGFLATPIMECSTDLRYLNQVGGWQLSWPREWQYVAVGGDVKAAVLRWSQAAKQLAKTEAALRDGIKTQQTAPKPVVSRVVQQVHDLVTALKIRDSKYFIDGENGDSWNTLLTEKILPALQKHEDFLQKTYLPQARVEPGMGAWAGGEVCFDNAVTWWTTLDLDSKEIEIICKRIIKETRADLLATAVESEDFSSLMARLRAVQAADNTTASELIAISRSALARAAEESSPAFLHAAAADIIVAEMPEHMQASFPAGFYQPPQGIEPAEYVINPSRPGERRLMAEVIAFHEGVPGHHQFFAYPREQELSGYNAGLLEGWAIYAEHLADELGLYSSETDRQGMLAKRLWAASRLIVEPGLHLNGWTREYAIDYMLDNTLLPRTEIEIEVDRYIAMPGQSLSYMLGADYLLTARAHARAELGEDAFDIRAFHDVILAPGIRPLPEVGNDILHWISQDNDVPSRN